MKPILRLVTPDTAPTDEDADGTLELTTMQAQFTALTNSHAERPFNSVVMIGMRLDDEPEFFMDNDDGMLTVMLYLFAAERLRMIALNLGGTSELNEV